MTNQPQAYYLTDAQVELILELMDRDSRTKLRPVLDYEQHLDLLAALGADIDEYEREVEQAEQDARDAQRDYENSIL